MSSTDTSLKLCERSELSSRQSGILGIVEKSSRHFSEIADRYDVLLPAHVQAHYLRKRVRLLGRLLAGGKALDVGCGTGVLMAALGRRGIVFGADDSVGMIRVLRGRNRGVAVCAHSDHLPFADSAFDLVFSVAMLHHVAARVRVRATLGEMVRVTRAGGKVVVWDHNPRNPYWPIIMRRAPQDTGEERLIPAEEIMHGLAAAGARDIRASRSGFMPEFMPRRLMPVAKSIEAFVEGIPLLQIFAAHNVIIARK